MAVFERAVSMADVPTLLLAGTPEHGRALEAIFGLLPPTDARTPASIDFGPGEIALPDRTADELLGDQRVWHQHDGGVVEQIEGLTARVSGGAAVIRGSCPELDMVLRWICQPVLAYLLAPFDRFLVHAGAVSHEGSALLLMGQSGSGKSSVTYGALRAGWDVLGDDHVVLRRGPEGIEITGIPKPLSVPGEVAGGLPAGARRMPDDERERWELPAGLITGGWHRLVGAAWVRHNNAARGELVPVDRLRLLRELIAAFPASGTREPLSRFMPLAAEVSRASYHELRLGRDPETRLDDAVALLGEAIERSSPISSPAGRSV